MKLTPDAKGTDAARRYLVELMKSAAGGDHFSGYVHNDLAGDFAWTLANHLLAAQPIDAEPVATGFDTALAVLDAYQANWDTGLPAEYAQSERIAMECAVEAVRDALNEAKDALNERECANEGCGWKGATGDTVQMKHGYPNMLCPQCHEVTESAHPSKPIDAEPVANQEPVGWVSGHDLATVKRYGTASTFIYRKREQEATVALFLGHDALAQDLQLKSEYIDSLEACLAVRDKALNEMAAKLQTLESATHSIWRYGADTLSGRTDGPDDRDWQRAAVLEMTRRAATALGGADPLDKDSK